MLQNLRPDLGHLLMAAGLVFQAGAMSARLTAVEETAKEPVKQMKELQDTVIKLTTNLAVTNERLQSIQQFLNSRHLPPEVAPTTPRPPRGSSTDDSLK